MLDKFDKTVQLKITLPNGVCGTPETNVFLFKFNDTPF